MHMFLDIGLNRVVDFRFANGWSCSIAERPDGARVCIVPVFIAENPMKVMPKMTQAELAHYEADAMRARGDWFEGVTDDNQLASILFNVSTRDPAPGHVGSLLNELLAKRRS